jgi:hypothetical protein
MTEDEIIVLTAEEATSLISNDELIHTFRSSPGLLMGSDWRRSELIKTFKKCRIEIGGDQCKAMGHGLVVWTSENNPLFVEADKDKIFELEKFKLTNK